MRELDAALLADLQQRCSATASPTSRGVREHHGKDESYHPYAPPDAVAFPQLDRGGARHRRTSAARHHTPMIPYGVGTSLEGHVLADPGRRVHRHEPA